VNGVEGLATAIARAREIDPETCREAARERFSAARMIARYMARYAELAR
jgi:hypothetical protein